MPIQLLPARLANQIAAGEVVERPASVVKELVENSLDAGATQLVLDIEQGGARRIRLRDNGAGIEKDQLELALSRHATSKISSLDDLEGIASLGFRGEALASISSVARLTLTSKPSNQAEAWQARCEGRDMAVLIEPAAHPDGTTIDVQDLFFNTPARRKFLRTEKTEFGHIDEVIKRIALAHPAVHFQLRHQGKMVRDFRPAQSSAQLAQRLRAITGQQFATQAMAISSEQQDWQLTGHIAPPAHCRHQSDVQYMYVNGRMMRDKLLSHAIRQAYGESLASDRQPSYVLYLVVPVRQVDVNVHPAKHEVRFHQARQVHDFVLQSLRQALSSSMDNEATEPGAEYQPPPRHFYQQHPAAGVPSKHATGSARQSATAVAHQPADIVAGAASYQQLMQPQQQQHSDQQSHNNQQPVATDWRLLKVLQQRYLLVERSDALALVDGGWLQQGIAQQQLTSQLRQGLSGQPLLLPVQLSLANQLTELQQRQLAHLGVQLKALSASQLIVVQVPAPLRHTSIERTLPALIDLLPEGAQPEQLSECTELVNWLSSFGHTAVNDEQWLRWWQQADKLPGYLEQLQPIDWQAIVHAGSEPDVD